MLLVVFAIPAKNCLISDLTAPALLRPTGCWSSWCFTVLDAHQFWLREEAKVYRGSLASSWLTVAAGHHFITTTVVVTFFSSALAQQLETDLTHRRSLPALLGIIAAPYCWWLLEKKLAVLAWQKHVLSRYSNRSRVCTADHYKSLDYSLSSAEEHGRVFIRA